jgi:hypothetical protein
MRVYILLFNAGTDNEGIHTIQSGARNKVLMFEHEDDATRFALMLEAQDFPTASVESIDSDEVEEFCRDAGYEWELIEEGRLAMPPEANIDSPDWNSEAKPSVTETEVESEMSNAELDRIRRQLEGLL